MCENYSIVGLFRLALSDNCRYKFVFVWDRDIAEKDFLCDIIDETIHLICIMKT